MSRPAPFVRARVAIAVTAAACAAGALLAAGPPAGAVPAAHAAKTYRLSANSTGRLRFSRARITASAGSVTLRLANPSPLSHGIALGGRSGRIVSTGGTSTVTAKLKAGTYTYYCPVGSHRAAGMSGRLTVR